MEIIIFRGFKMFKCKMIEIGTEKMGETTGKK